MDVLIFENKKLLFKEIDIKDITDCFDRLIYLKKKFLELNLETFNIREIYAVVIRERDIEINECCKHLSFDSIINETSFEPNIIEKHTTKILSKPC